MSEIYGTIEAHGATFDANGTPRQTPTKVQCAECHWQGLSSDLSYTMVTRWESDGGPALACPVCRAPFARYPQRAEHLWSDPY